MSTAAVRVMAASIKDVRMAALLQSLCFRRVRLVVVVPPVRCAAQGYEHAAQDYEYVTSGGSALGVQRCLSISRRHIVLIRRLLSTLRKWRRISRRNPARS